VSVLDSAHCPPHVPSMARQNAGRSRAIAFGDTPPPRKIVEGRLASYMHTSIFWMRRSIDNVVKTKIRRHIPVIDPNCWELRPCFSH
jgi:hypothetical protein